MRGCKYAVYENAKRVQEFLDGAKLPVLAVASKVASFDEWSGLNSYYVSTRTVHQRTYEPPIRQVRTPTTRRRAIV